jgi:hypothetical protein
VYDEAEVMLASESASETKWAEDEIMYLSCAGVLENDWVIGRLIGELIVKLARTVARGKSA